MRSVVVLPAPLGPRTPVMVPCSMAKLTSSTARTFLPKRLVRCSALMTDMRASRSVRARNALAESTRGARLPLRAAAPARGHYCRDLAYSSQCPLRSSAQYTLPATITGLAWRLLSGADGEGLAGVEVVGPDLRTGLVAGGDPRRVPATQGEGRDGADDPAQHRRAARVTVPGDDGGRVPARWGGPEDAVAVDRDRGARGREPVPRRRRGRSRPTRRPSCRARRSRRPSCPRRRRRGRCRRR